MLSIIEYYAKELNSAPGADKINQAYERGLLTYTEALQLIIEAAENNKYNFIIQYQRNPGERFHDYCDTLYSWHDAKAELVRLRNAAPVFRWRYRKELKM